jgi:hypothetical protein
LNSAKYSFKILKLINSIPKKKKSLISSSKTLKCRQRNFSKKSLVFKTISMDKS